MYFLRETKWCRVPEINTVYTADMESKVQYRVHKDLTGNISSARSIQFISQNFVYLRPVLISCHIILFLWGYPIKLCMHISYIDVCYKSCPSYPLWLNNLTILNEEYVLWIYPIRNYLRPLFIPPFPCSDILPSTLFTSTLNLSSHIRMRKFLALYRTDISVPLATVFIQYGRILGPSNRSSEHRDIQTTGNNVCTHVSRLDKRRVRAYQRLRPPSDLDNLKLCSTVPCNRSYGYFNILRNR